MNDESYDKLLYTNTFDINYKDYLDESFDFDNNIQFRCHDNILSQTSKKSIDQFKEGDILYESIDGKLLSEGEYDFKIIPIAICVTKKNKNGDYATFVSIKYMTTNNCSKGTVYPECVNFQKRNIPCALPVVDPAFDDGKTKGDEVFRNLLDFFKRQSNESGIRAISKSDNLDYVSGEVCIPAVMCYKFKTFAT